MPSDEGVHDGGGHDVSGGSSSVRIVTWLPGHLVAGMTPGSSTLEGVASDVVGSTSEFVRSRRLGAGVSIEELAARVGVSAGCWHASRRVRRATS